MCTRELQRRGAAPAQGYGEAVGVGRIQDMRGRFGAGFTRRTRMLPLNWLRVLGTAELPHIDQGVRQQFHAKRVSIK